MSARPLERSLFHPAFLSPRSLARTLALADRRSPLAAHSFATTPGARDADLRMSYCAFAICAMLDDWTRVDVDRALAFVARCRVSRPRLLLQR